MKQIKHQKISYASLPLPLGRLTQFPIFSETQETAKRPDITSSRKTSVDHSSKLIFSTHVE